MVLIGTRVSIFHKVLVTSNLLGHIRILITRTRYLWFQRVFTNTLGVINIYLLWGYGNLPYSSAISRISGIDYLTMFPGCARIRGPCCLVVARCSSGVDNKYSYVGYEFMYMMATTIITLHLLHNFVHDYQFLDYTDRSNIIKKHTTDKHAIFQ